MQDRAIVTCHGIEGKWLRGLCKRLRSAGPPSREDCKCRERKSSVEGHRAVRQEDCQEEPKGSRHPPEHGDDEGPSIPSRVRGRRQRRGGPSPSAAGRTRMGHGAALAVPEPTGGLETGSGARRRPQGSKRRARSIFLLELTATEPHAVQVRLEPVGSLGRLRIGAVGPGIVPLRDDPAP